MKECIICNKLFEHKVHNHIMCNNFNCKNIHRINYRKEHRKNIIKKCIICGNSFRVKRGSQKTCGKECRIINNKELEKNI